MANEIKITSAIEVENGNLKFPRHGGGQPLSFDQATLGGPYPGTIEIGTAEEVVSLSELTTLGWAKFINLDNTNYVTWGPESGGAMVPIGRMEPGEPAQFRIEPGITLRMQANTAACKVMILVFED